MAKILMRLKCAGKSWYSNFNLVPKNLIHSLQENLPYSNSNSILLNRRIEKSKTILSLISYPTSGTGTGTDDLSVVNFDSFPSSLHLNIRGHSHNQVCLSDKLNNIFLFNMATRDFSKLPPSIILPPPTQHWPVFRTHVKDEVRSHSTAVGFGYDTKSKDFKVVRVVAFRDSFTAYCYRTEIYNLSSGRWREIQTYLSGYLSMNVPFEMYDGSKGVYYWSAKNERSESILLFNMTEEKFSSIPIPVELDSPYLCNSISMGVWNGSIVLFFYPRKTKTFQIWVMEESDTGVSWSKAFTIDSVSGIQKPLQFLNSDQLLMIAKDGHLVSYNVKSKEFNNLPGLPGTFESYFFGPSR